MSFEPLDPNRYASSAEAVYVIARVQLEQAAVDAATKRRDHAVQSLQNATERLLEAEVTYNLCKAAKEQAVIYEHQAVQQLDIAAGQLALAKAPLHPVRKTPLEVLGLIFGWCIDFCPQSASSSSDKRRDTRIRQRQPFLLAAVCRRWRQVCHSCAHIWSTLDIQLDDILLCNVHYWLSYITTICTLSAQVHMHLRIFRQRAFDGAVDGQIVNVLVPMMYRCTNLVLFVPMLETQDALSLLLRSATPLLQELYVWVCSTTHGRDPLLLDAPKLRHIHAFYPFSTVTTTFPGAKTALLGSPVTENDSARDDIASLQTACPNLEDLTLIDPIVRHSAQLTPHVLNVPILAIKYSRPETSQDLLAFADQFSLPRIRSFRVFGDPEGSSARICFLAVVFTQWKTLSKLTISTISDAHVDVFCNALVEARNLGTLVLRKVNFVHSSLRRLCDVLGRPTVGDGAWVCPLLRNLDLTACTLSPDCAMDNLVEFVARRLRAADNSDDGQRPVRLRCFCLPQSLHSTLSAQITELFS